MSDVEKQLKEKENLILEISNLLMTWDDSVEHAINILEENDQKFQEMKKIDSKIPEDQLAHLNEKYREHWLRILNLQQGLLRAVDTEQTHTQDQLAQIDNKQKVVSNYMSLKNKSIFIEKDY